MSNDATTVMALAAAKEGWSESTQLELALRYIQNQGDNALFADWLTEHYAENQDEAPLLDMGESWRGNTPNGPYEGS